jgi:hypothetical protein
MRCVISMPEDEGALCGTVVMLRPRVTHPLPLEQLFLRYYDELLERSETLSDTGALLVGLEHDGRLAGIQVLSLEAQEPDLAYAIVGRHPQAHLRLGRDPSIALRHLFVRVVSGRLGVPEVDVRDLRTGQGFSIDGLGPAAAVRSTAQLFIRLGVASVMLLPRWTWPGAWPRDAADAWESLPPLCIHDHVSPGAAHARAVRRSERSETHITLLPSICELGDASVGASPGEHCGTLTLSGRDTLVTYPVTRRELEQGLLLGRYRRCQLGAELDTMDTWSRVHLLLLADDTRVTAYDTASTPGTIIDALHINTAELGARASLALGSDVRVEWQRAA